MMGTAMMMMNETELVSDVDAIEEMKMRTWARQHYTPQRERDSEWHPVILDEMQRRDHEVIRKSR